MYARISYFKRFYLKIKFLTTVDNVLFFGDCWLLILLRYRITKFVN